MTSATRTLLAALFVVSLSSLVAAGDPLQPLPRPTFAGAVTASVAGYYGYPRLGGAASTAHESLLRGRADVIRAQGENALLTAEALRSLEEAKSRYLDNEVKRLAVRQERTRMGIAERAHRYEQIQARRETTMAINRANRELRATVIPDITVHRPPAQSKLRMVQSLLESSRIDPAGADLPKVAQQ